jgi:hypothetical protein
MFNELICHGGPLDGLDMGSRFPKGFLLINKDKGEVIIYDVTPDGYVAGEVETLITDPHAPKNSIRAQAERSYDVVAYCPERMNPWPSR